MYMWKDDRFDLAEISTDFARIRAIFGRGGVVRIFLLWEDFQPRMGCVDERRLEMLVKVADAALERELLLDVTFFTGHMSGPNWIPVWMLREEEQMPAHVVQVVSEGRVRNCGYRNPYTDEEVIGEECLLLRRVVGMLAGHKALGLWNLANEPDLVAVPTRQQARAWVQRMVRTIRDIDGVTPITVGMHAPSLGENVGFSVDIFAQLDVSVIHGYPMYACHGANPWSRGPLDARFVPFLCCATSALSGTGRPTLAEEFGGCTQPPGVASAVIEFQSYGATRKQFMASEEEYARYLDEVLHHLVRVGASGAMLWCYADYAVDLYTVPPCKESLHERFFGLVRADGTLKPHAKVVERFAAENHRIQPCTWSVRQGVEYYEAPEANSRVEYGRFLGAGTE